MVTKNKKTSRASVRYAHLKSKVNVDNEQSISIVSESTSLENDDTSNHKEVYSQDNAVDTLVEEPINDNYIASDQDVLLANTLSNTGVFSLEDNSNDSDPSADSLIDDLAQTQIIRSSGKTTEADNAQQLNTYEKSDLAYQEDNKNDDSYSSDIYIQNVVRDPNEIELARKRNEQRRASALEHTQISTTLNAESYNDSQEHTSSIFINESEVVDEVSEGRRGRRAVKVKKQNFLQTLPELFKNRTKPRNFLLSVIVSTFKLFVVFVLIIGFSGLGAVIGLARSYIDSIPTLNFGSMYDTTLSSVIYDINGNVITNYYGSENREWAAIDEMPQDLKDAIIAIEDLRFYRHMGLDFKRLIGSIIKNLTSDSVQGGSTITQQLVKNQFLSSEQTYKRKIREAYIAIQLENEYEKDEILEFYLNTIPLGGLIYGVKTAARDYFDKDISELTLLECAMLAGVTNNPTRYNLRLNYYSRNNPKRSNDRTETVLREMFSNGFISQEEFDECMASINKVNDLWNDFAIECTITEEEYRQGIEDAGVHICETSPISQNTEMLYFVEYSVHDAITQLLKVNNLEDTEENRIAIDNIIRKNGYSIYTTVDPEQQKAAEEAVYSYTKYPSMRYEDDKYSIVGTNPDGTVKTLVQPQAASTVIDYRTGYIVAMVGGRQAPSGLKEFNRAYQSTMPVGSSIKPIAVYGPAIESGLGPGSIMYDTKSPIRNWDTELGYPRNYNDSGYHGILSLRQALTKSTNTVAAQLLMYYVGAENSYNTLVALGVSPEHIQRDGPGLALGTSGIPTLEMAGAYSAIANMGQYIQPISFTKIVDKDGNIVLDMLARQERRQVFKQSTAYQLIDMLTSALKTNNSRALIAGQTVGGKTGTTMESRGVFFSGFSGYYACAVWIGSDNYKPLASSTTGSSHAALLWHNIMEPLHAEKENKPIADLTASALGITRLEYCRYSGKLATDDCPSTHVDIGLYNDLITDPCTSHTKVSICNETGCIATEYCTHTKSVVITTVPTEGQLEFMYANYYEIYSQYWADPSTTLLVCGKHSGLWTEEYITKLALRDKCLEALSEARTIIRNNLAGELHTPSLKAFITQLEGVCNDLDNNSYEQIYTNYEMLYDYLNTYFPKNPTESTPPVSGTSDIDLTHFDQ